MTKKNLAMFTKLAILIALIAIMAFTPLGFLHVGIIEITFITIPVVIGAIILGPVAGALLGGVFGLFSFIQCFGMSAFGVVLLDINPIFTFILCLIPRILMGFLSGVIYKAVGAFDKTKVVSMASASLGGAVLNTLFFVGGVLLLFGNSDYIMGMRGGKNVFMFFVGFVGINGLIEAAVTCIVGTAICKVLLSIGKKKG